MKLSKMGWLILTIGICLIAFSSVGAARAQRIEEQNQLREELSVAKLKLNKISLKELSAEREKLEEELSQILSQFEDTKAKFPQLTDSIGASDMLFKLAKTCEVEILEIGSSGLTTERLEGMTISVLPLSLKAEGEIFSLISFITRLNEDLTTGIVKSAEIIIPVAMEGGEQEPSANIQLVIYTY